ncbi:hypothetical protein Tco_1327136 [Tanacetum coccineum]
MQATVRMALVNQFKQKLEKGKSVTLQIYSLGEIQPKYRMVNKALCLSFFSNTDVETYNDFSGSMYGFDSIDYNTITQLQQEEPGQFDVIDHVVGCEDLDNDDKNGKSRKKKPLTLVDAECGTIQRFLGVRVRGVRVCGVRVGGVRFGVRVRGVRVGGIRIGGVRVRGVKVRGVQVGGVRVGGVRVGVVRVGGVRVDGVRVGGVRFGGVRVSGVRVRGV